jgi:hypothetical protein
MSAHEQFADDLALHALNALDGEDRLNLEKHLATCPACRTELEQLRGDGALLALSTLGPKPPLRSRQRLLDAVAKESLAGSLRERQVVGGPRKSLWGLLGWAAATAILVFGASLWKENAELKRGAMIWSARVSEQTAELEKARAIANAITDPAGQHFTLVSVKTPAQPQGKAFYLRNRSTLLFVANNMPQLPPQKAYELWLIPLQGAPIPAGVFKPDAKGNATVVNPPLPGQMEAKAFAITVENEAGATTPTMPIVMMGTGE